MRMGDRLLIMRRANLDAWVLAGFPIEAPGLGTAPGPGSQPTPARAS